MRVLLFKEHRQSIFEEIIQRKRKRKEEAVDRILKRRRKESSDESLPNKDEAVPNGHAHNLNDVSKQPEDVVEENIPKAVLHESNETKQQEKKISAAMKVEVCEICEDREGGPSPCNKCKRVYHPACVEKMSGTEPNAQSFLCHNCDPSTDPHCSLCQKSEGEILSCSVKTCPLRYHPHCLKVFHFPTSKSEKPAAQFTCPAHYCHTCVADVNALHQPETTLLRCIRCPTSYHPSKNFFKLFSTIDLLFTILLFR